MLCMMLLSVKMPTLYAPIEGTSLRGDYNSVTWFAFSSIETTDEGLSFHYVSIDLSKSLTFKVSHKLLKDRWKTRFAKRKSQKSTKKRG